MKKRIYFFLIFVSVFTIFYCKQKVTVESKKPSSVAFLNNAGDTSQVEIGIDAVPEGDFIRLEWIPSSEDIVSGYEIFRKETQEGSFQIIANEDELESFRSIYVDEAVNIGIRYYYYILAVTPDGEKSDPSDTLDYELIKKANLNEPIGEYDKRIPVFKWTDKNEVTQQGYVIRLVQQEDDAYIWIHSLSGDEINWGGQEQSIRFNLDSFATIDSLEVNQSYKWRIDIIGPKMNCGSESAWMGFTVRAQ